MVLTKRGKSFWLTVIFIMIVGATFVIFFFLPILSIPLTDNPDGFDTAIKRSLFEHILAENFNTGLDTSP